jgi:hypothetical protein
MTQTFNRPKLTEAQIKELVTENFNDLPFTVDEFVRNYCPSRDSFEIAKEIDRLGSSLSRDDLEVIEEICFVIEDGQKALEVEWAKTIQPPYPVGTVISRGEITGISDHRPATYEVRAPGMPDNERLLIKFEDARVPEVKQ